MNKQHLKEILRKTVQQVLSESNSKNYKLSELTFDKLQQIFPEVNTPDEAFHLPAIDKNGKDSVVAIHNRDRFDQYKKHVLQNYGDATFNIDTNADAWVSRITLTHIPEETDAQNESVVNEAFIGPFVFNDKMSDDKLLGMYNSALDGYAKYSKGFQHSKSDYKQAYQEIEKILKKRGVNVDESLVTKEENEMNLEDERGYSKYLVSKDNLKGKTSKFDIDTLSKILTKIAKDIDERKLK